MISGHGGNIYEVAEVLGCRPEEILDMSSNLNPLGPPEGLITSLRQGIDAVVRLPEVDAGAVCRLFAAAHRLDPDRVFAGNGTTQFIHLLPQLLDLKKVLIAGPTYADYADACRTAGCDAAFLLAREEMSFQTPPEELLREAKNVDAVFLCNPNNPTGALFQRDFLVRLCRSNPETVFILDESYLPFVKGAEQESMVSAELDNALILVSMSKIFRIPGLRIGFLVAPASIANRCRTYQLPWSVNSIAQMAAGFILKNEPQMKAFVSASRDHLEAEKAWFLSRFESSTDISFFPGEAPFVLARLEKGRTAGPFCAGMAKEKILIRNCSNFVGLSEKFIRISFKEREENRKAAAAMHRQLNASG